MIETLIVIFILGSALGFLFGVAVTSIAAQKYYDQIREK